MNTSKQTTTKKTQQKQTNHTEPFRQPFMRGSPKSPAEPTVEFDLSWLALGRFGFSETSHQVFGSGSLWAVILMFGEYVWRKCFYMLFC